jgi:parallel beta-helix repeat protein
MIFFILFSGCIQQAQTPPTQTTNIGDSLIPVPVSAPIIITKPGHYFLTSDIMPSKKSGMNQEDCIGIDIHSSDVIFDGMGHVIDGEKIKSKCLRSHDNTVDRQAYGIHSSSSSNKTSFLNSNIKIRNVTISNWSTGILIKNGKNFLLENSTIYSNDNGLMVISSSNISILHNIIKKNGGSVIDGQDIEKITITGNRIEENDGSAIDLSGWIWMVFYFKFLGKWIILPQFHTNLTTNSGGGYSITSNEITGNYRGIEIHNSDNNLIAYNTIQDSKKDGIWLEKVDNSSVTDNSITNSRANGILFLNNGSNVIVANNTFSGNANDFKTQYSPDIVPTSVILGTVLIFLLKMFTGIENVAEKTVYRKWINWFSSKFKPFKGEISPTIFNRRLSSLLQNNITVSIIGAFILGGAFTLISSIDKTIEIFLILSLIGGIVGVVPRAVQYFAAGKYRMKTEYRMWWGGIIIIFITTLIGNLFGVARVFGQPVKTKIEQEESYERREIALVMLSGPLVSVLLSGGFLLLYMMQGTYAILAIQGLNMSLLAALVSFLPISPMEGERVFKWNKIVWVIIFVPILLAYGYFVILH